MFAIQFIDVYNEKVNKILTIDGRKISYWEKNTNKKPALILLHGFPGNHKGLMDMAHGLDDYNLIIPDLPGCGKSEPFLKNFDLSHYAEWLNKFLNALSIDRTILIGHSFGSRLALVFSKKYPNRVKMMILITPVVKVEGLIAQAASLEYKIAEILPKRLQRMWLANDIYQGLSHMIVFKSVSIKRRKELTKNGKAEMYCIDPTTTIGLFEELYRHSLIPPKTNNLHTKTLIIAGDLDEIAPLNTVRLLANRLINSKIVIMKNAGHLLVMERPLTTSTIIKNWLNQ